MHRLNHVSFNFLTETRRSVSSYLQSTFNRSKVIIESRSRPVSNVQKNSYPICYLACPNSSQLRNQRSISIQANDSISSSTALCKQNHSDDISEKPSDSRDSVWTGLNRLQNEELCHLSERRIIEKQDKAINAAMLSALQLRRHAIRKALSIYKEYIRTRNTDNSNMFQPSQQVQRGIVRRTVADAQATPEINAITSNGIDVAVESMFRVSDIFNVRIGSELLEDVLELTADDPDAERRAKRALSLFRYYWSLQKPFSVTFTYKCFCYCVDALDLDSVVKLMEFAQTKQIFEDHDNNRSAPTELNYYNGVMYTALMLNQYEIVRTAYEELQARKMKTDNFTENIFTAMRIDLGEEASIESALRSMKLKGITPVDCTYASLIRAAGRNEDVSTVLDLYSKFEDFFQSSGRTFRQTLSAASDVFRVRDLTPSSKITALGRSDPTIAMFQALRMCSAAEAAIERLQYLKDKYKFSPPRSISWIITETCFKGSRLDLAQQLRIDKENLSTRPL